MWVVLTSFGSESDAHRVVRILVEERLAACAKLFPGTRSVYRWKGEVLEESETVVHFKTSSSARVRLVDRLRQLHPYEEPELISVRADQVSPGYLSWLEDACGPGLTQA